MGTLSRFLSERASRARAESSDPQAIIGEWRGAVQGLLDQIEEWLREADSEHLLRIEHTKHAISERRLGTYSMPGLRVWFGSQAVVFEPNARYPIGSMVGDPLGVTLRGGRIDVRTAGSRYMIYRRVQPDGTMDWILVDDREYRAQPFSREPFEHAMTSLLG